MRDALHGMVQESHSVGPLFEELGIDAAGKSGTGEKQDQNDTAWFVAYAPTTTRSTSWLRGGAGRRRVGYGGAGGGRCVSGVTGAGKKATERTHYCFANENLEAYGVGTHRHTPEIEQNIAYIQGKDLMKPETWQFINFQPHLTPQIRGIEVTIYATLNKDLTNDELYEMYQATTRMSFVRVFPASQARADQVDCWHQLCCMTPLTTPAPSACWSAPSSTTSARAPLVRPSRT